MAAIVFVLFFAYAGAPAITTGLQFADLAACQAGAATFMAASVTPNGRPITSFECHQVSLP